ncbi:hypothetical protein Q4I28_000096 [Leishmania naiffi]|uniref:Uncharacterized protein n=1 Tax=Leishmania naiffi TaxID=5678 RepID=A0AAW3CA15_9TRYP
MVQHARGALHLVGPRERSGAHPLGHLQVPGVAQELAHTLRHGYPPGGTPRSTLLFSSRGPRVPFRFTSTTKPPIKTPRHGASSTAPPAFCGRGAAPSRSQATYTRGPSDTVSGGGMSLKYAANTRGDSCATTRPATTGNRRGDAQPLQPRLDKRRPPHRSQQAAARCRASMTGTAAGRSGGDSSAQRPLPQQSAPRDSPAAAPQKRRVHRGGAGKRKGEEDGAKVCVPW